MQRSVLETLRAPLIEADALFGGNALPIVLPEFRIDAAGYQAVATDSVLPNLKRNRLRKRPQRRLGGAIMGLPRQTDPSRHRRKIDNGARLSRQHRLVQNLARA